MDSSRDTLNSSRNTIQLPEVFGESTVVIDFKSLDSSSVPCYDNYNTTESTKRMDTKPEFLEEQVTQSVRDATPENKSDTSAVVMSQNDNSLQPTIPFNSDEADVHSSRNVNHVAGNNEDSENLLLEDQLLSEPEDQPKGLEDENFDESLLLEESCEGELGKEHKTDEISGEVNAEKSERNENLEKSTVSGNGVQEKVEDDLGENNIIESQIQTHPKDVNEDYLLGGFLDVEVDSIKTGENLSTSAPNTTKHLASKTTEVLDELEDFLLNGEADNEENFAQFDEEVSRKNDRLEDLLLAEDEEGSELVLESIESENVKINGHREVELISSQNFGSDLKVAECMSAISEMETSLEDETMQASESVTGVTKFEANDVVSQIVTDMFLQSVKSPIALIETDVERKVPKSSTPCEENTASLIVQDILNVVLQMVVHHDEKLSTEVDECSDDDFDVEEESSSCIISEVIADILQIIVPDEEMETSEIKFIKRDEEELLNDAGGNFSEEESVSGFISDIVENIIQNVTLQEDEKIDTTETMFIKLDEKGLFNEVSRLNPVVEIVEEIILRVIPNEDGCEMGNDGGTRKGQGDSGKIKLSCEGETLEKASSHLQPEPISPAFEGSSKFARNSDIATDEESILDILSSMADKMVIEKVGSDVQLKLPDLLEKSHLLVEEEFDLDEDLKKSFRSDFNSSNETVFSDKLTQEKSICASILEDLIDFVVCGDGLKRKRIDEDDEKMPSAKRLQKKSDFGGAMSDEDMSDNYGQLAGFDEANTESESEDSETMKTFAASIIDEIVINVVRDNEKEVIIHEIVNDMFEKALEPREAADAAWDVLEEILNGIGVRNEPSLPLIVNATSIAQETFRKMAREPKVRALPSPRPLRKSTRRQAPFLEVSLSALSAYIKEEPVEFGLEEPGTLLEEPEDQKPVVPPPEELMKQKYTRRKPVYSSPPPKKKRPNQKKVTSKRSSKPKPKRPPPVKKGTPVVPPRVTRAASPPETRLKVAWAQKGNNKLSQSKPTPPPATPIAKPTARKSTAKPAAILKKTVPTPLAKKVPPPSPTPSRRRAPSPVLPPAKRVAPNTAVPPVRRGVSTPVTLPVTRSRLSSPPSTVPMSSRRTTVSPFLDLPSRLATRASGLASARRRAPSPSPSPAFVTTRSRRSSPSTSVSSIEDIPPPKKRAVMPVEFPSRLGSTSIAPRKVVPLKNVAVKSTGARTQPVQVAKKRGKPYFRSSQPPVVERLPPDEDFFVSQPGPSTGLKRPLSALDRPGPKRHKPLVIGITIRPSEVRLERMPFIDRLLPTKKKSEATNICDLCEPARLFISKQGLVDHLKADHGAAFGGVPLGASADRCPGCDKKYHSQNRLAAHMKTCPSVASLASGSIRIGDLPARGVSVSRDSRRVEETLRHTCEFCGCKFSLWSAYESHKRTHWEQDSDPLNLEGGSDMESDQAEKERPGNFQSRMVRGGLVMKIRREKAEKPKPKTVFRCSTCGAPFDKEESLNLHMLGHRVHIKQERLSPEIEILEEYLAPPVLVPPRPPTPPLSNLVLPKKKGTARKSTGGSTFSRSAPSTSTSPPPKLYKPGPASRRKQGFFAFHK